MRILVVDDTKSMHAYMRAILEPKSHETDSVFDGTEAVEKIDSGEQYDLILLDWEMPSLSGLETLKKLRGNGTDTPILMVTSKNSPSDIKAALDEGANEYVLKPFTEDVLIEKISFVTAQKR